MHTIYYESFDDYLEACGASYQLAALESFTSVQAVCPTCGSRDKSIRKLVPDTTCHEYGGPTLWDSCVDLWHSTPQVHNTYTRTPQSFIETVMNWLDIQMEGYETEDEQARR